jgi:hypothetical protein
MTPQTEDDWNELCRAFEKAGLTQRQFAEKNKIELEAFRYFFYQRWRRPRPAVPRMLPVSVVSSAAPKARQAGLDIIEVLLPSGLRLRFAVGTDAKYLGEIFKALG